MEAEMSAGDRESIMLKLLGKARFVVALLSLGLLASPAQAVTLNIKGEYTGGMLGPVSFDVTIDSDFSSTVTDQTAGLTVNSASIALPGGLGYSYSERSDILFIGGLRNGVNNVVPGTNDFAFQIVRLFSPPQSVFVTDVSSRILGFARPEGTVRVSPIPIPATASLLLLAISILGAFSSSTGSRVF